MQRALFTILAFCLFPITTQAQDIQTVTVDGYTKPSFIMINRGKDVVSHQLICAGNDFQFIYRPLYEENTLISFTIDKVEQEDIKQKFSGFTGIFKITALCDDSKDYVRMLVKAINQEGKAHSTVLIWQDDILESSSSSVDPTLAERQSLKEKRITDRYKKNSERRKMLRKWELSLQERETKLAPGDLHLL